MTQERDPSEPAPARTPRPDESVVESVERRFGHSRTVRLGPELETGPTDGDGGPPTHPVSPSLEPVPKGRGNYRVIGEIARGGMGVVLRGRDADLGRDVAIKVLDERLVDRPESVRRFVEEAQIGGQLQHPGIVPVYEMGLMADERPYFAMKLIRGQTLSVQLRERATPEEDRIAFLRILLSVCNTVAYAHAKSVIHRDLKPQNVMVGRFGEVQVVDWGLAKVLGAPEPSEPSDPASESRSLIETVRSGATSGSESLAGAVMGTPAYMAPEQALGAVEDIDRRTDVFALGAMLCEILTGRPPYIERAGGPRLVLQAARGDLGGVLERLASSPADQELQELCLECLGRQRSDRPADARAVAERVNAYLSSTEERARQAELAAAEAQVRAREERRRRLLTLTLAGTILVATVAIGGVSLWVRADRNKRIAATRDTVLQAHDEVAALQSAGRYEEALEVARGAERAAETGEADDALRWRAQRVVEAAQRSAEAENAAVELAERNRALTARFEDLRTRIDAEAHDADAAYAEAFREYGLDLDADDQTAGLEAMLASGIAEEFAAALDDWANVRSVFEGWDTVAAERLAALASDLDPHPARMEMRRAITDLDVDTLLSIGRDESFRNLPPRTIYVLAAVLRYMNRIDDSLAVVQRGVARYPGDFLLNWEAGRTAMLGGHPDVARPYLNAARALRPGNVRVRRACARAEWETGDLVEVVRDFGEVVRAAPEDAGSRAFLGAAHSALGEFDLAVEASEAALAVRPGHGPTEAENLVYRFFAGEIGAEQVAADFEAAGESTAQLTLAWGLVDHPDPEQRRPELVRPFLESLFELAPNVHLVVWTNAVAAYRTGRARDALDLLERSRHGGPSYNRWGGASMAFLETLCLVDLGELDAARGKLAAAERHWESLTYGNERAWEQSILARYRDEARRGVDGR